MEVTELLHFMRQQNLPMDKIFKTTSRGIISRPEFEAALRAVGFKPRDP